ncbi:tape measure protein [Acinetobacter towneri]|uniref:tape measure protein n=1 Tax=Acinetobacter towneri TaxID=202956 RepID=UPI001F6195F4|nr:tape measure protein [Acinetobacter towneri]UNT61028.1 tape measure protein [Acinetobacter towneri]
MSTKLGTLTLDLIAKIGSFTEPMKKAGDTAQRETKRIESSVSSASKAIAGLGAAALAGLTVGSVINMADEYTQMAARIRNATADTAEYDMVQKRLLETANGTYRSLSEAQEVYLSLAGGMKSLGKTTEETLNVADSLSYAFVANAARADQAQSAMDALNKSMAKGKIDADAWISIVSAADNIIADMAKVTGKTEAEIRQLGATGKIALSDLLTTLEVTKDANQALADNMENSLADGLQKVRNSFSAFVGEINVTYGVTSKMAGALSILADNLNVVATAGAVVAVAMGSRMVVEFGKTNAAMLANTIATRNKVLADYERAKADLAATAAMVQSMGPMNAQTAAMMSNAAAAYQKAAAAKAAALSMGTLATAGRGALVLFGGPIGLGLTVATVAASYLLMRDNTDKSTESLRANNQTVADAVQKYKELGEVKQREQLVVEKEQLAALNDEYDNAASKLVSYSLKVARHSDMTREQAREVSALALQYKSGAITLEDFSRSINSNKNITQQAKDEFNLFAGSVKTAGDEAGKQNSLIAQLESTLYGVANGGDAAAGGIRNATNALSEFAEKAKQAGVVAKATNTLIAKGYNPKVAADLAELAVKNGQVSREEAAAILFKNQEQEKLNKTVEAYNKTHATSSVRSRNRTAAVREETKALRDQNRALEEQQRNREQISKAYASDYQNLIWDEKEQLDLVRGAGFSSAEQAKYLALVEKRFAAENAAYFKNLNLEINQYKWSEEKKLEYAYQMDREILENDVRLADEIREAKLQALDEQYALELQKARFHAQNVQQAMRDSIKGLSYGADDIFAKATMSPQDYAKWSLENDRSIAQASLKSQRVAVEQDIMTSDAYSTDDERYAALLEAHQEYRDAMAAIDVDYNQQVKDLEFQQYESTMQMYGSLLSQAGSVWGNMTQMVKDSAGEQSGAYKAMFLMQQMFAIGSALVSTHLAAAQVMADPSALTLAQKTMYSSLILGMGYANVGLIAGQTIAGMAHDGIDNIPKEGTWLLDKGERVVDSRTNSDLKDFIANGGSSPQININVPPGYTAEQSRGADGAVTIDIVEKRIKQSWSNLGNPNSYESKQVQRNTTAGVKR